MKNERNNILLEILLSSKEYMTVDQLADRINVSNKTTRTALDDIEQFIETYDLVLERKQGYGIFVKGTVADKNELLEAIPKLFAEVPVYSSKDRKYTIALKILLSEEPQYISDLADALYYSRSTVSNDLKELDAYFDNYKVRLVRKQNRPIVIEGKERRIRSCLADLIMTHSDMQPLVDLIVSNSENYSTEQPIIGLNVSAQDIRTYIKIMKESDYQYTKNLPLQSFIHLLIYLVISVERFNLGYRVSLTKTFIETLEHDELYEEIEYIFSEIERQLGNHMETTEKRYMQVYFLSQNRGETAIPLRYEEADEMAKSLVQYWITKAGIGDEWQEFSVSNLREHLISASIRFQHGIRYSNPMLKEIKKQHKKAFDIVKKSLLVYSDLYDEQVSDEEIGYLTLHYLTLLNKVKEPYKVIVVSHLGLGSELYLTEKLKKMIANITITQTLNYFSYYDTQLDDYDLIITTLKLNGTPSDSIVVISPLLNIEDILEIRKRIDEK